MFVVGFMSGTSLDGLSIGYVQIDGQVPGLSSKFITGRTYAFPDSLRRDLSTLAKSKPTIAQTFAKCHRQLGLFAADSLRNFIHSESLKHPDLAGFHGQTVYHEPNKNGTTTLQIGDPSLICAEFNIPVVSDFRSMDTAVGGQGAPMVPIVDYLTYRSEEKTRVVLNIGGIANITVLPCGCDLGRVLGFDVGPGNILIDSVVERLTNSQMSYDKDGAIASNGAVSKELLDFILRIDDYRSQPYPKTTGRELYGEAFVEQILTSAKQLKLSKEEIVTTVTEYTSLMITHHLKALRGKGTITDELIVGGGGSKNHYLMDRLRQANPNLLVEFHDKYGVPSDFWESYAFAVLAYLSYSGFTGNVPSVTGASKQVSLGRINLPAKHFIE